MALKRKLDDDFEDSPSRSVVKQLKLVPFPSSDSDSDSPMSDAPMDIDDITHHSRLSSAASSVSSSSDTSSPPYPTFDLYPSPYPVGRSYSSPVGLLQPSHGSSFTHHTQNCTQIPKLRVACEAGPNGQRSMWALCESCGAIEMVES
ncbi:hypothetical protein BD410DRAFT_800767 [Rickenella mellea]|uniref:Uncharacterized protein n=1 Tax=Rickenella mellea TaxID=50990 RepID=A0A4Y7QH50_9AGAM|nr:hypothetical protein BD410DRAFT_800767 [Rickenella mellea]